MKKYLMILLVAFVVFGSQIACNSDNWESQGQISGGGLVDFALGEPTSW